MGAAPARGRTTEAAQRVAAAKAEAERLEAEAAARIAALEQASSTSSSEFEL